MSRFSTSDSCVPIQALIFLAIITTSSSTSHAYTLTHLHTYTLTHLHTYTLTRAQIHELLSKGRDKENPKGITLQLYSIFHFKFLLESKKINLLLKCHGENMY